MSSLQLTSLLLVALTALTMTRPGLGALLSADAGYQYDRPAFSGDFGRRPGTGGRPAPVYGPAQNSFGRQPGSAYQPGFDQSGGANNQGFQGNAGGDFQGFNGGSGRSRPYSFEYEVKDAASGNDYGQQESGDEYGMVRGEYRVLLPDTRTQIVRYTADDANGYVADVRYEGEAQFPRNFGPAGFQQGRGGVGGGGSGSGFGGGGGNGYNGGPAEGFGGYAGSNQYLPPSAGSYGK